MFTSIVVILIKQVRVTVVFLVKIRLKTICKFAEKLFTVLYSPNTSPTTDSTLAQLLEIDKQLSAQEALLRSQLESIQHKRQSLQIVISLFNDTDKTHLVAPIEEKASTPQEQSVEENSLLNQTSTDESLTISPTTPASKKGKKTVPSSKKSQTRKTQRSKAVKQFPGWQQYLREEFRNSSLPQAISEVLHSQAERVWDISAVVNAIFQEEIPHEVKKKVRLQITNLLAQGVREKKWYRGQQGSYTLSEQAV